MKICPLIQNQLYIHSSGEVFTCSFLQNNPKHVLGNITQSTLRDIWKSHQRASVIQNHQQGELGLCQDHQKKFLCNKMGNRHYFDNQDTIKRLDIMLDSACNLKCIMCTNIYDRTGGLKDSFFWDNNDDVFSSLVEIELVGGEPLISPYFPRLVEKVMKVNPKCRWFATTNAHYDMTDNFCELIKKVPFYSLAVSLDSLKKDIFEKIRVKGHFEKVYQNIFKLQNLVPELQINTVIQQDNFQELLNLYRWAKQHCLKFYPILLQYPDTFSLKYVDESLKEKWILEVMKENEVLKSKEILFFIKKFLTIDSVKNRTDIKISYLKQLELFEAQV